MKILKLTTENVKRISVVEITPEGNLITIGGKNGAGKTSVIDSIQYALAGADSLPKKPVRQGEDKAKIEMDLGDMIVKRTFTATGGTTLVVTNKDGVKFGSPQALLDGLVGKLSFDPLEFAQQRPEKQSETLSALLGLDFTAIDNESATVFVERTAINRDVKALQNRLQAMPYHADASGDEQSTEQLFSSQEEASRTNAANSIARNLVLTLEDQGKRINEDIVRRHFRVQSLEKNILDLQKELAQEHEAIKSCQQAVDAKKAQYDTESAKVSQLKDIDLAQFKDKLTQADLHNRKLRENKAKEEVRKQFAAKEKESDALTAKLDALAKQKRKAIASAKFPIEGLGLDDARAVTFEGLPFEQASTALQLRVSIAIGIALNKKLPVLLIRRGSDLDSDSLKLVAEMAEKANAQVWLERVGTDGNVSVLIEDGHVAEVVVKTKEGL